MSFEPTECQAISGGEYAARLLGVDNPTRLVDHLIEHLSAKTGAGHESALLEFKATYHPSPECPDDSDVAEFEWNVMKSFIALANAQGGCVLIGLEEDNDTHEIKRGDWDPDQILSTCQEDRTRIQRDGQEEKDLINHVRKTFFSDRARRNGKNFRFLERQSGRDSITRDISIDGPSIARLSSLVELYPCHSETFSCNVLAAVVRPVVKDGELILVQINDKPETLLYRDSTAQTIALTGHHQIRRYEDEREPESPDFALQLHTPHIALRAKATVFSNIPPHDPNFIGREGELARLHELCLSGKIPLIHAAGGTGKTQLAFKYAALHAKDYPGGRFYIPAEITTNWDDALQTLIAPRVSTLGISALEYLGLKTTSENDKPNQGKQQGQEQKETRTESQNLSSPPIQFASSDIINALVRRSRDVGKVLILLDNVEKPAVFFSNENLTKAFPADFADIAIIATSRTTKGINQRAALIEKFPLGDLSQTAALELLCGPKSFSTDEERSAAESIVRILECRALYVRRVAMLVEDTRRPYSRLYNKLLADKLRVVQPQEDEDDLRTPEVIWNWTREHIAKSLNGEQDTQLAQTIAIFPADGVADRILEALWYSNFGELGPKESLDAYRDDCDLFHDALKRLSEYSLIQYTPDEHIVRMHRLDRAAIQKSLKDTQNDWERRIGTELRACLCFSPTDWVELGNAHSPLLDYCPWESIGEHNVATILAENPKYQDNPAIPWNSFSDIAWWMLLSRQPEFIDLPQCKPVFLTPLLAKNPYLRSKFNLADFNGRWWATLLCNDISLSFQCPWKRLTKHDWLLLLSIHPEMLDHCPNPEILNASGNLEQIPSKEGTDPGIVKHFFREDSNWGAFLSEHPDLKQLCNFNLLSHKDCISILKKAPQFASSINRESLVRLTGDEWTDILKTSPEVISCLPFDAFPKKHFGSRICRKYDDDLYPGFLDHGVDWGSVIKENPKFRNYCPFSKLSPADWCSILIADPSCVSENPPWKEIAKFLTDRDIWFKTNDTFSFGVPVGALLDFHELDPYRPAHTPAAKVHTQGAFRGYTDVLDIITLNDLSKWIKAETQPSPLQQFHVSSVSSRHPQLKRLLSSYFEKKDFEHTRSLDKITENEFQFLMSIPNGLNLTHYEQERINGEIWSFPHPDIGYALSEMSTDGDIAKYLDLITKPDSLSKICSLSVAIIISSRPTIECNIPWDKLDGNALCLILVNRPSLKEHCDFSKFSGRNWAVLLSENPEFEDICDWSKLDESDWTYLLNDRPWMIEHKPS